MTALVEIQIRSQSAPRGAASLAPSTPAAPTVADDALAHTGDDLLTAHQPHTGAPAVLGDVRVGGGDRGGECRCCTTGRCESAMSLKATPLSRRSQTDAFSSARSAVLRRVFFFQLLPFTAELRAAA